MKNWSNKQKELLLKGTIVFGAILSIFLMTISFLASLSIENIEQYNIYVRNGMIVFSLLVLDIIFLYYLMGKVKITYKNIKSKKIKLNIKSYKEFESKLLENILKEGYTPYKQIDNKLNCSIKYTIQWKRNIANVILIVKTNENELEQETYEKYFEFSLECICREEPSILDKEVNLIHIVCTQKMNDILKKIEEQDVHQGYGRFNLPVCITFSSSNMYIPIQKDGYAINKYKKLQKTFKKYTKDMIESTEK